MPSSSIATAGLSLLALAALLASTAPEPVSAHGLHEQRFSLGSTRRRHHARLAAASAQSKRDNEKRGDVSTLVSGLGMGTLYFDINGGGTCGPVNGWHSYAETNGFAMCEPNSGYKTLAQRGSNRVVAMPSNMLAGNLAKYCGKEVVVTYGDNTVENLVLWDGCASCNSNNGLDFSSTVFAEIFGESKCGAGRISGMSWKITSKQIWSYPDGNPVSGNDNDDDDESAPAAPSADPTSSSSSTPLAPSSSSSSSSQAWSESSSWVASSSSSSSSNEAKPVGKPINTKVAQVATPTSTPAAETPAQTDADNDDDEEECDAEDDNEEEDCDAQQEDGSSSVEPVDTASLPPVLVAVPKPTAATSSSAASPIVSEQPQPQQEQTESSASPVPAPTATKEVVVPVEEPSAAAPAAEQPAASSGNGSSAGQDGGECNSTPGAWKCVGQSLQQCVQNPGDWTWMTRVECKVDIINCDSPNPVCASY